MLYQINQFLIESDLELPAAECIQIDYSESEIANLNVYYQQNGLTEFSDIAWSANIGNGFLRSYDVKNGVLICADERIKMQVDLTGSNIILDFDNSNKGDYAGALALSTNSGISICTLLRGDVPLHGAGVEVDEKFIGIMAPSGVGKTTLLWALLDSGGLYGNDDVIPVHFSNNRAMAIPSISLHAKLDREALERRKGSTMQHEEWTAGSDEFWIPIEPSKRVNEARPLSTLFVLHPLPYAGNYKDIHVKRIQGGKAISLLMENTQGLIVASQQIDAKKLFENYKRLSYSVPIYAIYYHKTMEVLPLLVKKIRNLLQFI